MTLSSTSLALSAVFATMLLAQGCVANRVDLIATKAVTVQTEQSSKFYFLPPTVAIEDGTFVVLGQIRRQPSFSGEVRGHVDVVVVSEKGEELKRLKASLWQQWIPIRGSRQSGYSVRTRWNPPPGSMVRLSYREHPHEDNPE